MSSEIPEQGDTGAKDHKLADGALSAASNAAGIGGAEKLVQGSQSDGSWGGDIKEIVEHAKAGATVASVVPGAGTAAGAAVGAAAGLAKNKSARRKVLLLALAPLLSFAMMVSLVFAIALSATSSNQANLSAVSETVVTAEGLTSSDVQTYMEAAQGSGVQWTVLAAVDRAANSWSTPDDGGNPTGDGTEDPSTDTGDDGSSAPSVPPFGIEDLDKFNAQLVKYSITPITQDEANDRVIAGRTYGKLLAAEIRAKDYSVDPAAIDVGAVTVEGQDYRSIPSEGDGHDMSLKSKDAFEGALQDIPSSVSDQFDRIYETALRWTLGQPLNCTTTSIATGQWVPPTYDADGKVGSGFGMRFHPIYHKWIMHEGSDLGNVEGTPIFAAHDGKVVYIGANSGAGNFLKIDHGNGIFTQYLHMNSREDILVNVGDEVTAGQQIAKMGNAGASTSPHLHFEVIQDGKKIDPEKFYASMGLKLAVKEEDWAVAAGAMVSGTDTAGASNPDSVTATKTTGESVTISGVQIDNASTIIGVGQSLNLDDKYIEVALMVGLVESNLKNLASEAVPESKKYPNDGVAAGDADSVGIMQQRKYWGNVKDRMDVTYATQMFFGGPKKPMTNGPRGLLDIPGYANYTDLGQLAQKVQVSAFPDRYAQWQPVAEAILAQVTGKVTNAGCAAFGDITMVTANIEHVLSSSQVTTDMETATQNDPNVVVLNEVGHQHDTVKQFAEDHGYYASIEKGVGANAILISKSLGTILSSGLTVVQDVPGYNSGNGGRSVSWCTVATASGNLTVMVTHALPHIEAGGKPSGGTSRTTEARRNFELVKEIATEKAAIGEVLFGGDLNVNYHKDKNVKNANFPYHILEGDGQQSSGLMSVFSEVGDQGLNSLSGRLIDYIYSWKSPTHQLVATGVSVIGGTLSDHDFVQASFAGPDTEGEDGSTIDTSNMDATVATIVKYAMSKVGDRYVWATAGPNTFDCSGLTLASYRAAGIKLPHYSGAQAKMGRKVSENAMQPGDLIFYYSPIHHVALYVGNGMMVHARNVNVGVVYQSVKSYPASITTVRRILSSNST